MSTVQKINFEPVSDILLTQRRDFGLADKTLADPFNAVALVDGEWVVLNDAYKLVRASTVASVGNPAAQKSYPLWSERGRSDTLGMAEVKKPIIFLGDYEADTRIYNASVTVGSGLPITATGQPLKVATITLGSRNYSGIVGHGGAGDAAPIVGRVTRLPTFNGGRLRFVRADSI